ncbi:MAG: YabP/YqfC family sporulation protein [Clostridia bacterium]|nr:YabP/YqfC family sporulation protein [Clostridia bacterium]
MHRKVNKFAQMLDMPRELDKKQTKVTIISFDEILIENYKGIMEYEEFFVKINTEIGIININGFNLNLEQMTNEDVLVKGVINSIDLERVS